jgi:hypothetical protein
VVVLDFAAQAPAAPVAAFEGRLELVSETQVGGWACDARDVDKILKVELWSDDRPVAATMANVRRDDLRKAGVGDGAHGFVFELRVPPGNLDVRISGTTHILKRSDGFRDLTKAPRPPALQATPEMIAHAIIERS